MKKWLAPGFLCIIIYSLCACSSGKSIVKPADGIDGSWTLKNITIDGLGGKINANAFNEADYNCFTGSTWQFSTNNNGNYTLENSTHCAALTRTIRWTMLSLGEKQLEITRLNNNAAIDTVPFRLNIISINKTDMQLKHSINNITFMGKPIEMVYNFVRN